MTFQQPAGGFFTRSANLHKTLGVNIAVFIFKYYYPKRKYSGL